MKQHIFAQLLLALTA